MKHEPTDPDEPADREDDAASADGSQRLDEEALAADSRHADRADRPLTEEREDAPRAAPDEGDASPPADPETTSLSIDERFELLASPGNRFVLTFLLRGENPATYAELVDYVVERAAPPAGASAATFRGRVAARLVHRTLPTLAEAGLLTHDRDAQTVTATPAIETVAPYLALAISQSADVDGPDFGPDSAADANDVADGDPE